MPVRGVFTPVLVSDPSLLVQGQESLNCFPLHKQALKRFFFRTFSSYRQEFNDKALIIGKTGARNADRPTLFLKKFKEEIETNEASGWL